MSACRQVRAGDPHFGSSRCHSAKQPRRPVALNYLEYRFDQRSPEHDHGYVTVRPLTGDQMPELIDQSRFAVEQEAASLGPRLENIFTARAATGPGADDWVAWRAAHKDLKYPRRKLTYSGVDQARLIYGNAYDHLVTLGRILGGDGQAALFAHTTLARSVAEAAVRIAWLLDPDVTYEHRMLRATASIYEGALNRAKGFREVPEQGHRLSSRRPAMVADGEGTVRRLEKLIGLAGIKIETNKSRPVRLVLDTEKVSMNFETGTLMRKLLPEFPALYTVTSAIAHSTAWMLNEFRDNHGPEMQLTLNQTQLATAAQAGIASSELIVKTYARYYGLDLAPYVLESRQRIATVDRWIRQHARDMEAATMQVLPSQARARRMSRRR
jgi:hypothetical protein